MQQSSVRRRNKHENTYEVTGDKYKYSIYYVHLVGIKRSVQRICKTTKYITYSYRAMYFPYLKWAVYEGTKSAILINMR